MRHVFLCPEAILRFFKACHRKHAAFHSPSRARKISANPGLGGSRLSASRGFNQHSVRISPIPPIFAAKLSSIVWKESLESNSAGNAALTWCTEHRLSRFPAVIRHCRHNNRGRWQKWCCRYSGIRRQIGPLDRRSAKALDVPTYRCPIGHSPDTDWQTNQQRLHTPVKPLECLGNLVGVLGLEPRTR